MLLSEAGFLEETADNFDLFVERVSLSPLSFPLAKTLEPLSSNSVVTPRSA